MYNLTFNLLERMNRDFGYNFDNINFERYITYNPNNKFVENLIVSKIKQEIYFKKIDIYVNLEKYES